MGCDGEVEAWSESAVAKAAVMAALLRNSRRFIVEGS
jgi:hypothetical protein